MARIAGVDLPRDKRIVIGLTYIYGIGNTTAKKILAEAGVSEDVRVRDLTADQEDKIVVYVIVVIYQFVVKTRRTMRVHVKAQQFQLQVRRNNLNNLKRRLAISWQLKSLVSAV